MGPSVDTLDMTCVVNESCPVSRVPVESSTLNLHRRRRSVSREGAILRISAHLVKVLKTRRMFLQRLQSRRGEYMPQGMQIRGVLPKRAKCGFELPAFGRTTMSGTITGAGKNGELKSVGKS